MTKLSNELINTIVNEINDGNTSWEIVKDHNLTFDDCVALDYEDEVNEAIGECEHCALTSAFLDGYDMSNDTEFCMAHKDYIYGAAIEYYCSAIGYYSENSEQGAPNTVAYEGNVGNVIEKYRDYIDTKELAKELDGYWDRDDFELSDWERVVEAEKYHTANRASRAKTHFNNELDKYEKMFTEQLDTSRETLTEAEKEAMFILEFKAEMKYYGQFNDEKSIDAEMDKYRNNKGKFLNEVVGVELTENGGVNVQECVLKMINYLRNN